jgi:hypothetical protein
MAVKKLTFAVVGRRLKLGYAQESDLHSCGRQDEIKLRIVEGNNR